MLKSLKFYFFLFFTINSFLFVSQSESSFWIVGSNKYLDFSNINPVLNNFPTNFFNEFYFLEANCSFCDENGSLLYYSSGDDVYSSVGQVIQNGSNLSDYPVQSCTQGCSFIKFPGKDNELILFTLEQLNGYDMLLNYNVIDIQLNKVLFKKKIQSSPRFLEKMQIINHCDRNKMWLVVSEGLGDVDNSLGTEGYRYLKFYAYEISTAGVNPKPIESIVTNNPFYYLAFTQMKSSNNGKKLAIYDYEGLSLFDFDNSSGSVQFNSHINVPDKFSYGIEFSPNNELVYSNQYQVRLNDGAYFRYTNRTHMSSLSIAPDKKVYRYSFPDSITLNSGFNISNSWGVHIARINNPDVFGVGCNYDSSFVDFVDSNCFIFSFPNLAKNYIVPITRVFEYGNLCKGLSSQFYLNPNIVKDSVLWEINGEIFSGIDTVQYVFPEADEFEVSCTVFNGLEVILNTECVEVCGGGLNLPANIDLCQESDILLNAYGGCFSNYSWNTGDTLNSITVNQPGLFTVEAKNECGIFIDSVIIFKEDCQNLVEIPNVFTPNSDSSNDDFNINVKEVKSFEMRIFNRWGEVVCKASWLSSLQNISKWNNVLIWDGNFNNIRATEGVYFYKLDLISESGNSATKTGYIHLFH